MSVRPMRKVMITGWAGFIGSNLVRMILRDRPDWEIHAVDAHTYAARPAWALADLLDSPARARFVDYPKLDIVHRDLVSQAIKEVKPDIIIHLAAESHVCRSIEGPRAFLAANVVGTFNLLDACRYRGFKGIFHHVSTDEVFGELPLEPQYDRPDVGDYMLRFNVDTPYAPRSPYAASKAASDHFVMAYHQTYGLDTRITNCSNNFGPNQHDEKLIPKTILSILRHKPVTVYGEGKQVRDWIWVDDHSQGILDAIERGKPGWQYLLGGQMELSNLQVVERVALAVSQVIGREIPFHVVHTNDRPTDDLRYAIDTTLTQAALDWKPQPELFQERLRQTVRWYLKHERTLYA